MSHCYHSPKIFPMRGLEVLEGVDPTQSPPDNGESMLFELSLKKYLWIQGILIFLGLLFLLWRPKKRLGLSLKFGKSGASSAGVIKSSPENIVEFRGRDDVSRNLQVFFNYNGHTFEAYEALGLPAGASLHAIQSAFSKQKILADSESRPFLEAAFEALNSSLNSAKN